MSRGFAVVLRSKEAGNVDRGTPMRVRWQCIHHGNETANKRGLEEHVERDEEGKITSQRKEEHTYVSQMSCKWGLGVSFKARYKGNKGGVREEDKTWILTVTCSGPTLLRTLFIGNGGLNIKKPWNLPERTERRFLSTEPRTE
jgi:hypothetical protein